MVHFMEGYFSRLLTPNKNVWNMLSCIFFFPSCEPACVLCCRMVYRPTEVLQTHDVKLELLPSFYISNPFDDIMVTYLEAWLLNWSYS